jgi:PIN domain nuclease of toxin-antitoxin system
MKLLLDTQVLLWFISADARLSNSWRDAIRDPANTAFLSVASVWEAVIKSQLGKLPLPAPAEIYLPHQRRRHSIRTLSIHQGTVAELAQHPPLHRDPFDRIIIAQARRYGLTVMSVDSAMKAYPVSVLA